MSEEMKMSEVFKLPVTYLALEIEDHIGVDEYLFLESEEGSYHLRSMRAKCATTAINNHDRLTEENRKLREALKLITGQSEKYTAKTKGKGVKVREIREYDLLSAKQLLEELRC